MREPVHVRRLVRGATVAAVIALGAHGPALAAVEPGLYVDPARAAPGASVTLFTAADYVLCFEVDGPGNVLADRAVSLAPAPLAAPAAADLVAIDGTWSEGDGGLSFAFVVPELPAGMYRAYVDCGDRLEASTGTLTVTGTPDTATAAAPHATPRPGTAWSAPATLALLGGILLAMVGPARPRRRRG